MWSAAPVTSDVSATYYFMLLIHVDGAAASEGPLISGASELPTQDKFAIYCIPFLGSPGTSNGQRFPYPAMFI